MPDHDTGLPDDIDQKIRINELSEELREVTGHEPVGWTSPDCPPELHEEFLKNMLAYEKAPFTTELERAKRDGCELPEASTLDDAQLSAKLAALIENLGKRRTFLYHTNHLSDRELYVWLRDRGLREEVPDMPVSPDYSYHLDVLGSYGPEDCLLYNRYYATEEQRAKDLREYPNTPMPPHEDPKYDRDRTLPSCGF
jgi:hypothetical protein